MSRQRGGRPFPYTPILLGLSLLAATGTASAYQPPPPSCPPGAAKFELAPWMSFGTGVRFTDGQQKAIALVAANLGATVPIGEHLRLGVFSQPGTINFTSFDVAGGPRIELQTNDLNHDDSEFFGVPGRWTVILDGGPGARFASPTERGPFLLARLAVGFSAPNRLYHLYGTECRCAPPSPNEPETKRYCRPNLGQVSGARLFAQLQRPFDGRHTEWIFGLEFEPIGAGWWLLGAR